MNLQIYIQILPFSSPPFKETFIFSRLKTAKLLYVKCEDLTPKNQKKLYNFTADCSLADFIAASANLSAALPSSKVAFSIGLSSSMQFIK